MTFPENQVDYFSKMQATEGWLTILESFARFVAPQPHTRVLDIGTGPGALVKIFRQQFSAHAIGADLDPAMVAHAQRLHSGRGQSFFVAGRLPRLPFANSTFDCVTATNVIYLLGDPVAGLYEIARIVRPHGMVAMLNPSEKMSIEGITRLADERGLTGFARDNLLYWAQVASVKPCWSAQEVEELFAAAGLRLTETRLRIGDGMALYARGVKLEETTFV